MDWLESFVFTFVPLFIVIDALGNLAFVLTLSEGLTPHNKRQLVNLSIATAVALGVAFLFLGRFILNVLGISVGAFAIAGGSVLLVLSIYYMVTGRMVEADTKEMVAVVPIGTPLLMGPATITTLLLLATQFPIYIVLISLILNLIIAWVIFRFGTYIAAILGRGGLTAVSKVFSLLLAAIAVSMIISGLQMLGMDIGQ
ncbi:MAG: MarC family protein [Dehalococcoidia bacterium]|nr:MarC family protein [Dehalococcoidia bacterium]